MSKDIGPKTTEEAAEEEREFRLEYLRDKLMRSFIDTVVKETREELNKKRYEKVELLHNAIVEVVQKLKVDRPTLVYVLNILLTEACVQKLKAPESGEP